jgi:hypothetical protein
MRSCSTSSQFANCLACLIIYLIIQAIRRDPSGSIQIDGASNVSRPDPSGADQIDAEHQATDLAVGVRIPRGAPNAQLSSYPARGLFQANLTVAVLGAQASTTSLETLAFQHE